MKSFVRILLAAGLLSRKAKVPAEMHIYGRGKHGFGLGKEGMAVASWPGLCGDWLAGMGMCERGKCATGL